METQIGDLQPLQPGTRLELDWCDFPIPRNIEVGENSMVDSSSTFKKFLSELPIGLKVGSNVTLQGCSVATEVEGFVSIGDFSFISGATIIASQSVEIGSYVFVAGGVTIVDTDFHPIDPALRLLDTIAISGAGDKSRRPVFEARPVRIHDEVWIGFNATVLKGVTIGKGAIIDPGAVVVHDVPAGVRVSGNPAAAVL